jgi:hypothetical protein
MAWLDSAARLARRHWFDLLLAAGFVGCIGAFIHNSLDLDAASGIGARVARQVEGVSRRKPARAAEFQPAARGTEFLNLDAVWVGPGQTATLRTDDGGTLELEERTFLVLRKPFRPRARLEDRFRMVSGRVRLRAPGHASIIELARGFREMPRGAPKTEQSPDPTRRVYPEPGARLWLQREKEVPLTWVVPVTGFLAIQERASGRMRYVPIRDQSYARVALPPGAAYTWQVLDEAREVKVGPYAFEILPPGRAAPRDGIREGLKQRGSPPPLDVH